MAFDLFPSNGGDDKGHDKDFSKTVGLCSGFEREISGFRQGTAIGGRRQDLLIASKPGERLRAGLQWFASGSRLCGPIPSGWVNNGFSRR
jgi:hypothetical protein